MNKALKLMVSFLIVISLAALSFASNASERIDLAKFAGQPEALAGRMIEVDAQVIAINADGKSLELFDAQSRTRVSVRLNQLKKAARLALMHTDVRAVSVTGRASVVEGRLTIDAEIVRPLPFNAAATVPESDGPQTEVVPLAVFN